MMDPKELAESLRAMHRAYAECLRAGMPRNEAEQLLSAAQLERMTARGA